MGRAAEEGLKSLAKMPAEQQEMARKMILEQAPAEHRDLMEAFLRSPAEGRALAMKKAKDQMKGLTYDVEFKADKTWTGHGAGMGDSHKVSGTWSLEGDQLTIVTTTKNEKPATGDDAKPFKATLKGDTITGKPEANGPVVVLKRK